MDSDVEAKEMNRKAAGNFSKIQNGKTVYRIRYTAHIMAVVIIVGHPVTGSFKKMRWWKTGNVFITFLQKV